MKYKVFLLFFLLSACDTIQVVKDDAIVYPSLASDQSCIVSALKKSSFKKFQIQGTEVSFEAFSNNESYSGSADLNISNDGKLKSTVRIYGKINRKIPDADKKIIEKLISESKKLIEESCR